MKEILRVIVKAVESRCIFSQFLFSLKKIYNCCIYICANKLALCCHLSFIGAKTNYNKI